jgi:hypothetical protein
VAAQAWRRRRGGAGVAAKAARRSRAWRRRARRRWARRCGDRVEEGDVAVEGWAQAWSPGSSPLQATQPQPVGVAGSARQGPVGSSASTTVLSEAALRPARWRASSCRPKLGGALNEDLTPAASTTCERSAMLAHPSTELVAQAPCQLRRAHARSVTAARARLRPPVRPPASQQASKQRLEVDKTRKRDVQTGGAPQGPRQATPRCV